MKDGYVITQESFIKYNRILNKVKSLGKEYYHRLGCASVVIINDKFIEFCCDTSIIEPMQLLDFSFQGLVDDMDKINEMEKFGKYECEVHFIGEIDYGTINYKEILLE